MKTVLILGVTSDIGRELGIRFERDGWRVVGTSRKNLSHEVSGVRNWTTVPCDLSSVASVDGSIRVFREMKLTWDLVVVAAGTEEPIGPFFECDSDEWERGFSINSLAPLRFLRGVHPLRARDANPNVVFFSGSGTNNASPAYSAYCGSKVLLIKMCELLNAEIADTAYFIIGPGIVRTKIHNQTLASLEKSGANYQKVVEFLGSSNPGTSHEEIYRCLIWCISAGKTVVGGRNFALAHDAWLTGGSSLAAALAADDNLYKLRRHGNEMKFDATPK
jgi:NAD(P)-dependent dehydrogenase (short-subunit alcohol dehydrogenase family)